MEMQEHRENAYNIETVEMNATIICSIGLKPDSGK